MFVLGVVAICASLATSGSGSLAMFLFGVGLIGFRFGERAADREAIRKLGR